MGFFKSITYVDVYIDIDQVYLQTSCCFYNNIVVFVYWIFVKHHICFAEIEYYQKLTSNAQIGQGAEIEI